MTASEKQSEWAKVLRNAPENIGAYAFERMCEYVGANHGDHVARMVCEIVGAARLSGYRQGVEDAAKVCEASEKRAPPGLTSLTLGIVIEKIRALTPEEAPDG